MMYSSVLAAVVAALAADTGDNTSKQAWQKLYDPQNERAADFSLLGGRRQGLSRAEADCWLSARLHRQLSPRHLWALVARYSTHKGRKVEAISKLIPLIESPAPSLFRYKAVTTWAIPALKGERAGRRSTDMIVLPASFYDMKTWDLSARPESTRREWRRKIHAALDARVAEALAAAARVIEAEGVIFRNIA